MDDIEGTCYCGASSWSVSATLISCRACDRVWGRVNGRWVYDYTSAPSPTILFGTYTPAPGSWLQPLVEQVLIAALRRGGHAT